MNRIKPILCALTITAASLCCNCTGYFAEAPEVYNQNELQLMLGATASGTLNEQVLKGLQLYCFDRSLLGGTEPESGVSRPIIPGNPLSPFHHEVRGLVYSSSSNTLSTNMMRTGKWDMAMVSPLGATLVLPRTGISAGKNPMYIFNGAANHEDAPEIFTRYLRLPEVKEDNHIAIAAAVARNVAKLQITIDRATGIETAAPAGSHTLTLGNIPACISWAGTLLRSLGNGKYETSTGDFDTAAPICRTLTFSPGSDPGTFCSNTVTYIIPAHRGSDFWSADGLTPNASPTDTITKKLTVTLSLTEPGGKVTTKKAEVPMVPRCNQILDLHIRMKDRQVEINSAVSDWEMKDVTGDVGAPYLNISGTETSVYDGIPSRIYFWSNQPDDKVYVEVNCTEGNGTNVPTDRIFESLGGHDAANRHYDAASGAGWIDIIHKPISSDAEKTYKIRLNAGGLSREITVTRNKSAPHNNPFPASGSDKR